jgi:hypothetical protein
MFNFNKDLIDCVFMYCRFMFYALQQYCMKIRKRAVIAICCPPSTALF